MNTIEYSTLIWQIFVLAILLGVVVIIAFLVYKLVRLINSRSSASNDRSSKKQNSK